MPSDGVGRYVREPAYYTRFVSLIIHSTAVCCTVRTTLSGFMTNPDVTCKLLQSLDLASDQINSARGCHNKRWLETVSKITKASSKLGLKLIIPRPEVNIGIVCANAPVIRPLYLFFRGRLASQIRSNNGGVSKEGMWPGNTTRAAMSPAWGDESNDTCVGDAGVSLEMGFHQQEHVHPQSPLKEKPFFIMGGGR